MKAQSNQKKYQPLSLQHFKALKNFSTAAQQISVLQLNKCFTNKVGLILKFIYEFQQVTGTPKCIFSSQYFSNTTH